MVQNATAMGANAVTMMRFDSSEIGNTMSEIVAYGTAQLIEPLGPPPAGDRGAEEAPLMAASPSSSCWCSWPSRSSSCWGR